MKKVLVLILILVSIFSIIGCAADREYSENRDHNETGMEIAESKSNEQSLDSVEKQRKLIKNLVMRIEVIDIEEAIGKIENIIIPINGYIHNQRLWEHEDDIRAEVNIKVPSMYFTQISSELRKLGEVIYSNISSTDVTEEFIDLVARRKTFETQETRLLSFIDKAENVDELLSIERELERVRFEIERIIGRINYLENATDYSNINISLYSKVQPASTVANGGWEKIIFAFKDGIGVFGRVVIGIVTALVWLFPFIIVVLIFIALFLKYSNVNKKNHK
ncbi:MAG: DUF4349 domain-containing protein [Clostridiales bacterium]|nr:DUF4349 domain-containing protein [Clostridiales bacterium]